MTELLQELRSSQRSKHLPTSGSANGTAIGDGRVAVVEAAVSTMTCTMTVVLLFARISLGQETG